MTKNESLGEEIKPLSTDRESVVLAHARAVLERS